MSSKTKKESKKISNSSVHVDDNQVTTTTENTTIVDTHILHEQIKQI